MSVQDTITDGLSHIKDIPGKIGNAISDGSIPNYLLAGGAGALAGGGLSLLQEKRKGESKLSRLARVLGNAALVGGGAAGATALFDSSLKRINTALPEQDKPKEQELVDFATSKPIWSAAGALTPLGINYGRSLKADNRELKDIYGKATGSAPEHASAVANSSMKRLHKAEPQGSLKSKGGLLAEELFAQAKGNKDKPRAFEQLKERLNSTGINTADRFVGKGESFKDIKARVTPGGLNFDRLEGTSPTRKAVGLKGKQFMQDVEGFLHTHGGRMYGRTPGKRALTGISQLVGAGLPYAIGAGVDRFSGDEPAELYN